VTKLQQTKTATVGELIAKLSQFPQDMGIDYTWEFNLFPVVLEQIEIVDEREHGHRDLCGPVVVMDAETFFSW